MSKLTRHMSGDKVIHKSNPKVQWIVTAPGELPDTYDCTTVQLIEGQPPVHAYTFHQDELDRGHP